MPNYDKVKEDFKKTIQKHCEVLKHEETKSYCKDCPFCQNVITELLSHPLVQVEAEEDSPDMEIRGCEPKPNTLKEK